MPRILFYDLDQIMSLSIRWVLSIFSNHNSVRILLNAIESIYTMRQTWVRLEDLPGYVYLGMSLLSQSIELTQKPGTSGHIFSLTVDPADMLYARNDQSEVRW